MDTADLQIEHFAPLVGETVTAGLADGTIDLVVTEAVDRPTGNPDGKAFSVLFVGPTDRVFQQGTVELHHPGIGTHHVFLVAIAEDDEGRTYEAVFTRMAG